MGQVISVWELFSILLHIKKIKIKDKFILFSSSKLYFNFIDKTINYVYKNEPIEFVIEDLIQDIELQMDDDKVINLNGVKLEANNEYLVPIEEILTVLRLLNIEDKEYNAMVDPLSSEDLKELIESNEYVSDKYSKYKDIIDSKDLYFSMKSLALFYLMYPNEYIKEFFKDKLTYYDKINFVKLDMNLKTPIFLNKDLLVYI